MVSSSKYITAPAFVSNRYRLIRPLGQGGMGIVYLAIDRLTGSEVALKRVTIPETALQFASMTQEEDIRLALAREFQVLASLRHPNIISVLDYGFDEEGQPFFTMDYLPDGRPLVEYGRSQPPQERINLLIQLLQALAYLYRRDIIHRDLKPDNVLVVDGRVKVLDFGLAISRDYATEAADDTTGTVAYMAPEILTGEPASTASDLYAIGIMAYELFAGRHPFDTRSLNTLLLAIHTQQPDLDALPEEPPLRALIGRLLEKEPSSRINDVREVLRLMIDAAAKADPDSGIPPTLPESDRIRDSYLQAAKFVGRETERRQLTAALDKALQGKGSAWLLAGESGVGKSRLVDEMRIQAVVSGARVLHGQATEAGGRPFELWRSLLRHLLLIVEPDELTVAVLKAVVPDIEQLLGWRVSEAPEVQGDAAEQRLISSIVSLFQQLKRPVVLLLEDLQWANHSLEPLRPLVNLASTLPLLILGNFRDDETPDLPQMLPQAHVLKLPRLTEQEVAQLSQAILGQAGKQRPIISLLQQETEGNAFFVVEVLRTLAEEAGRLDEIVQMELPRQVVAGGVQQIVQRRLARVPSSAQPLLQLAAVSGRQLDLSVLSHIAQDQIELEQWLVTVSDAAVLENKDAQWRFTHDKLRQGVLDAISENVRPSLHRQVAQAIESIYPDDQDQTLPLVEHWRQAGDVEREAVYAPQAIEQLITISSFEDAAVIAHDVANVYRDADQRAGILRQLGEITKRLGNFDQATNYLEQSLRLASESGNSQLIARALLELGDIVANQNNYSLQHEYYLEALASSEKCDDKKLLAQNLHELAMATVQLGDFDEAEVYYQKSLALGRELDFKWAIAACLNGLGWLTMLRGDYSTAQGHISESLINYRAIGDRRGEALSLNNLGNIARFFGGYDIAKDYYQQALYIREEIGVKWGIAGGHLSLGMIAFFEKDFDTAASRFEKCLAIWQELGARWGIAQSTLCFGRIDQENGFYGPARTKYEEALRIYREIHDDISTAVGLIHLGFLDLDEGRTAAAHKHLIEALRTAAELGNTTHLLEAVVGIARYYLLIGNAQGSAELVGLVTAHPSLSAEVRATRLESTRKALARLLSPDELHAALERGEAMELETAVQTVIPTI